MKVEIKDAEFLEKYGNVITLPTGEKWYHYPFWVRNNGDNTYDIVSFEHLPENLMEHLKAIRNYKYF